MKVLKKSNVNILWCKHPCEASLKVYIYFMFYEEPSILYLLGIIAFGLLILLHRNPTKYAVSQKRARNIFSENLYLKF